ncbi:MAG: efflux RND transporter permease subunit [Planctomycetes bacterium]|nr:efflux RND transporter permease subunit [Planctomycetota bacterium]
MNLPRFSVQKRATILTAMALCMLSGVNSFFKMSRREDPRIVIRTCYILTRWPGASATKVEQLVTDPLEKAAGEIDEVKEMVSESKTGLSVIYISLEDDVWDVDQVWDKLRARVERSRGELPQGAGTPIVDTDFDDVYAVCLALYQTPPPGKDKIERPYTPREMEILADRIEDELKEIESVAKVKKHGVQPEVVYLDVDSADWGQISLTPKELGNILEARNIVAPGGEVDTELGRFSVKPTGEFEAVPELDEVVVGLREEKIPIRLGDLEIAASRRYEDPPTTLVRYGDTEVPGAPAILIAASMKDGRNIIDMGEEIDRRVRELRASELPADVALVKVNDLPRQVDEKIDEFVENLWEGMAIVVLIALVMIGWRPALIMASAIPLSIIGSLAVVALMGVELESCSIASLIIALGMLVDNAIVVSDNAVRLMGEGVPRVEAAWRGAQELAIPILTSTLTTVAAFLPMILIPGNLGEYIRSLPIVVSVTLLASFFAAMTVTPLMCALLLKPKKVDPEKKGKSFIVRGYKALVAWCIAHRMVTLGGAAAALAGALALLQVIGSQFFPPGYRDQCFVHIWLPEGSSIAATDRTAKEVEEILRKKSAKDGKERMVSSITFVGSGGPRLFLASSPEQTVPNYAYIVVNTSGPEVTSDWVEELRAEVSKIPGARIDVRRYDLGPGLKNPVEWRLSGEDAQVLRAKAAEMVQTFREVPGTVNPYDDWKNAGYQIEVDVDEEAASLAGVTNADVADAMNGLLSGAYLTTYREGDHSVEVLLRVRPEQRSRLEDLSRSYVNGRSGKVPLGSVARVKQTWEPAVIVRRDQVRAVTVGCQVAKGHLPNDVSTAVAEKLADFKKNLPSGMNLAEQGEMKETNKSQDDVYMALQIGIALIVLILIAQYNSFLKPFVIMMTVPLALVGAFLGLWVTGWPLGFMACLGIVSLAGVVVNNAIILIDFVETGVAAGQPLRQALVDAGVIRMRPIMLTSLTTIGGLFPLALAGGPLWEPMAWVMIYGLVFSTFLTLVVIPTVYCWFAETFRMKVA